jgi:hypothetical protein
MGALISRGEGPDGYNSYNRGVAGDADDPIDLENMTIKEIKEAQALPQGDSGRLMAVGKYQMIPVVLRDGAASLGVSDDEKFSPELQERLFREYLIGTKRKQIKGYITGTHDDLSAAQLALAREFASVADPNTGRSYYDGIAGNSSTITSEEAGAALEEERKTYKSLIDNGSTPEEAWRALSD